MWIYGPCGVGENATGLALYEEMAAEGRASDFQISINLVCVYPWSRRRWRV